MAKNKMNKEQINELLEKEWYIQGINAVPAYIQAGPVSGIFSSKKVVGYGYSCFILDFKNDYCGYQYSREDLHHVCDEFLNRYKKDKNYLKWIDKTMGDLKKTVMDYISKNLNKINKFSDEELIAEYKKFANIYYFNFAVSHLAEGISLTSDAVIKDLLLKQLQKLNLVDKFTEYFTEFTQPTRKFFFSEFNKSMVKMKEVFEKGEEKELNKMIENHIKEFYWIKSQWSIGIEYSKKDVMKELKELVDKKEKIKVTTDEELKKNLERKKELFKELELSKELIDLIEVIDYVAYMQDDRKIVILKGAYVLEKFVNEIGKRFGFNPANFKYLLPDELDTKSIKDIDEKELELRRKGSVYLYLNEDRCILSGKDYLEFKDKLEKHRKEDDMKELTGTCASLGSAVGRAKVCISSNDISKVEKGDVLVTTMTRPEFVPAMKKASAIITDEGGITCHAAIISRELEIPCIIGTKRATKVLKDNDLVEVNANHSSVKLLK